MLERYANISSIYREDRGADLSSDLNPRLFAGASGDEPELELDSVAELGIGYAGGLTRSARINEIVFGAPSCTGISHQHRSHVAC